MVDIQAISLVHRRSLSVLLGVFVAVVAGSIAPARAQDSQPAAGRTGVAAKSIGTVKAISGKTITLTREGGSDTIIVVVQDGARLLRIEPGQTDLKSAASLQLEDLQPGDRILVSGKSADEGKSLLAVSVIAMKKADIAEKRAHEREEWQKHGVGGLVSTVDPATGTITIATSALGANENVTVNASKGTTLRRYAPGSVKFDEATSAPLAEIKVGDQLRARGTRSADGSALAADEIVSGSFRNIAGTITAIDVGAGTITVTDLATKKQVLVKINSASQLRKLPPARAQRIAARLNGTAAETQPAAAAQKTSDQAGSNTTGGPPQGGQGGASGTGQGGAPDLQQAISRMPAATLADLQKGDAVMIVATPGTQDDGVTAITLLAGVEPILQASPNSGQPILTPWSLSSPGGDAATP